MIEYDITLFGLLANYSFIVLCERHLYVNVPSTADRWLHLLLQTNKHKQTPPCTCSPFSHNYNVTVFKAALLVYWKEKSWTQYFAFSLCGVVVVGVDVLRALCISDSWMLKLQGERLSISFCCKEKMAFINFSKNCTLEPRSILKPEWKNPLHGEASTQHPERSIVRKRKWRQQTQSSGGRWERVRAASSRGRGRGPLRDLTTAQKGAKQESCHLTKDLS